MKDQLSVCAETLYVMVLPDTMCMSYTNALPQYNVQPAKAGFIAIGRRKMINQNADWY